jgi:hypothetical protein
MHADYTAIASENMLDESNSSSTNSTVVPPEYLNPIEGVIDSVLEVGGAEVALVLSFFIGTGFIICCLAYLIHGLIRLKQ